MTAIRARETHRARPEKADFAKERKDSDDGGLCVEAADEPRTERRVALDAVRLARRLGRAALIHYPQLQESTLDLAVIVPTRMLV